MFDFGNANNAQREAISHVNGPLLITAGPGTGKTFTLVKRIVYLIQEYGVQPEEIMIATFTEKAAKELVTRITNELISKGISVNINEMYVGTFHSICLRIIKEHLEFTDIKKNYRMLDGFDQQYLIFRNIERFRNIEGYESVFTENGSWKQASAICGYVSNLGEELIDFELMLSDPDEQIRAIGGVMREYEALLLENNMLDFSSIQTQTYKLLKNNSAVLEEIRSRIRHIMIDEYQDTNYIQEQLVFLLAGEQQNIAVVGDDDQGLYRFRGATIRNILEFPQKFAEGVCKQVALVENYRSDSQIVDFYNDWISVTERDKFHFEWENYRYDKTIKPFRKTLESSPTVIKVSGKDCEESWHENVLRFIHMLQDSGKLTNLNQIAFLFSSVKGEKVRALAEFLEANGINVYSPRSEMFFQREEIRLALGCMMQCFPDYVQKLCDDEFEFLSQGTREFYLSCMETAQKLLPKYVELSAFIESIAEVHSSLADSTDYAFSGLLYQMFGYSPFADILTTDMHSGAIDLRPARNLSTLSQVVGKYEYLHNVKLFKADDISDITEIFFNMYMKFVCSGGIGEYEDNSEYAPSGCVSFLTIHQSKGMEFPIVAVGSLSSVPTRKNHELREKIEEKYAHREAFEPADRIKFFDFWRKYYTAFSRAQDLLVLTCTEKCGRGKQPSKYFEECYSDLKSFDDPEFNINEFDFKEVKDVNIKETYSFTSHISVYEACSLQYKFFKELGFAPVRVGATIFGSLVHQTIEDVHRAVLRNEENLITHDNISLWLHTNYATISKSEHAFLGEKQIESALKQVCSYVERQNGDWSRIQEAEVDVSLIKPEYILKGAIDLIKGEGDSVEIVDFKSERKPDISKANERVEHYRKQLQVYAHLVEEHTGKEVSRMHLYYTGTEGDSPILTFEKDRTSIERTIAEFDEIVGKIQKKDFSCKAKSQTLCENCDFRYYCRKTVKSRF